MCFQAFSGSGTDVYPILRKDHLRCCPKWLGHARWARTQTLDLALCNLIWTVSWAARPCTSGQRYWTSRTCTDIDRGRLIHIWTSDIVVSTPPRRLDCLGLWSTPGRGPLQARLAQVTSLSDSLSLWRGPHNWREAHARHPRPRASTNIRLRVSLRNWLLLGVADCYDFHNWSRPLHLPYRPIPWQRSRSGGRDRLDWQRQHHRLHSWKLRVH